MVGLPEPHGRVTQNTIKILFTVVVRVITVRTVSTWFRSEAAENYRLVIVNTHYVRTRVVR